MAYSVDMFIVRTVSLVVYTLHIHAVIRQLLQAEHGEQFPKYL